jgi:N-acetylmuramoyl-L-alanine amidase
MRPAGLVLFRVVLWSLAGSVVPPPASANEFPVATDVRVGGDDVQTRLVVDLSEKIEVRAFTLVNPYRVVIDMPQVSFQLPPKAGEKGRGLIKAFRFGLVVQGVSRMVIDLGGPARVDKAFVTDAANGQPARLFVDLIATDREAFMRAATLQYPVPEPRKAEGSDDDKRDPRPLIVLDPGHGGIDHGGTAPTGEAEKTIVLEFAHMLRQKLETSGKYRVIMTRTDDTFVALRDRVALSRSQQAALFISIHTDSVDRNPSAHGATVYTLSERASDARAARLAEAENQADTIAGLDLSAEPKDVAGILIDIARRETKTFSLRFAQTVVGKLKPAGMLREYPIQSAAFVVLKAPDVPSVLIELGYITNDRDRKDLMSGAWRSRTADSISQAIAAFFTTRLPRSKQEE